VQGTRTDENHWLRSWSHDLYLWYSELPDLNPANYTTADYFDRQKTSTTTPSGQPKDRFHFTIPTAEWQSLAQGGVVLGYGVQWIVVQSTPPRRLVVAYVEAASAAASPPASLPRGAEVQAIDGVDLINASDQQSIDRLNAGLFPSTAGESHTFTITEPGVAGTRTITLQAASLATDPVPTVRTLSTPTGNVGYVLFNDHYATAEAEFMQAVDALRTDAVTDLVLDLRYNGGGYLAIASEVAYMIAGPGATGGRNFETLRFNDKHPTTNPVTGQPIEPLPFLSTSQGLSPSVPQGTALPSLDLPRVFVLTGPNTCSASESIINSLRGIGVDVIQIGATTCGKPYGFYPADNCGTTYFSIEFASVNTQGFGDYPDGFSPQNTTAAAGVTLPGCSVADDFINALGDPSEARLAQALEYRASGACSAPPAGTSPKPRPGQPEPDDGEIHKHPWRENRILLR
jgi:carboxyl-terminal processing protease